MKTWAVSVVSRNIFKKLRILAAALTLLVATFATGEVRAQAVPKTAADFAHALAGIDGLDKLKLGPVKVHGTWAETTAHLRGEAITLVAFKPGGAAKPYVAVVPADFKLTSFLPIPRGTPIDGISFRDMAFVVVPKGAGKKGVSTASLPGPVKMALSHLGNAVDLKDGIGIYGEANFTSAGAIKTLLGAVGHSNLSLPLSGAVPTGLFGVDLKKASRLIKDTILQHLDLQLPLPRLKIPGMPSMISVSEAQLAIVSEKDGANYKVISGVTGTLDVNFAGKKHGFGFNVLAIRGGHADQLQLQASTKDKISLDLVRRLDLTKVDLSVTRKGGKWAASLSAVTKFNNKSATVTLTQTGKGEDIAVVDTSLTLADMLPGGAHVPGLTDVKFTRVALFPDYFEVRGSVKGMDMAVVSFKHQGKRYIATNVLKDFDIGSFIPGVKGTPLDDAKFEDMVFIWAPQGGVVNNLPVATLTPDIATPVKAVAQKVDLKAGVNVIGRMVIARQSKIGKMLNTVGAYKSSVPLIGNLSPKIFHPGSASQFKNEILDALDLNIPLPAVHLPGLPSAVNIQHTNLTIKGKNDKGTRSLDVDLAGRLDVSHGSAKADFDYEIELVRKDGQIRIKFDAAEVPGTKLTLNMVERFELSKMSFHMDNLGGKGWAAYLEADTKLRNTPLRIVYIPATPNQPRHINIHLSGLTIGKLLGVGGLPGIDDIRLESIQIYPGQWLFYADVKGVQSYIVAEKAPGGSGYFVSVDLVDFSPARLIPGAENSPLKNAKFKDLALVYSPLKSAKTLDQSGLGKSAAAYIKKSNKNPTLKPGMNIFGHLDIHPSGQLASLLKEVGVTDLKLPLSGGFSPKALSPNPSANKNEILDHLDIEVPLPELKLPGVPKAVDIKHTLLAIKGKNDGGKRSIGVDVAGELEFAHGSSKADFDFDVKLEKKDGKNTVEITATEVKNTKLTIDMVEKFELSNMSLKMDNGTAGGWSTRLKADSKIGNTQIRLTYAKDPKSPEFIEIDTKDLTVAKLVGDQGLPGLDDVALSSIVIYSEHNYLPAHYIVKGTVKGHATSMQVQKAFSGGHFVAVYLGDLNLGNLIPGAGNSPLKHVEFTNVAMLYSPAKVDVTLAKSGVILNAQAWIQASNANPVIKPGMNVFGHMDIKPTGELGKLLKDVGVTQLKLPLNGGFSPKALAKNHSAQDIKNSILDNLDIKIDLPKLKFPGVGKHLSLKNDRLEIKGKLPDGTRGLSVKVASDAEIKVKDEDLAFFIEVDYDRSLGAAATDLEIKGHTDKPWNKPFGIDFLNLEELTLDIRKRKAADGTRTYDIDFAAKTDIGSQSKLDITVDVHEKNGKITDAFFELDGPLSLADIPEVNKVPHADKFTLTKLIFSEHGVEADTKLGGNETDFFAFHGSGWNVALTQENFNLGEIIPTPGNLLKEIKFPFAAVMLSESGLNKPFKELSKVGQDALEEIFSNPNDLVDIKPGLAFVAGFHPKNSGKLGKHLKGMGVHDGMIVMGEVGGLFGGTPTLTLEGILASAGTSKLPKFMNFLKSEHLDFYISASEEEFDIGLDVGLTVKIMKDLLTFDTKIAVKDVDAGELGIGITGGMEGTWHKPFDIPGFSIGNVLIDATMDEAGLKLGFTGSTTIVNEKITIASDIQFSEALIPDAVAFKGSVSEVDIFFIEEIATKMIGQAFKLDIPQSIFPKFKDVSFAFVSSGAEDQAIGLTSEGFGLSGQLDWLGHEKLGQVKLSVSPTSGIYAAGDIDPINLGPLELKENHFNMKVGITEPVPSVKVKSKIKIEYLGLDEKFDIVFNKHGVSFDAKASLTKDLSLDMKLKLTGIDLSATKPSFKNADFFLDGDFTMDIGKFIAGPATVALNDVFNDLDGAFQAGEKKVKAAKKKVDGLTKKINAERKKVRKEKAKAEGKVKSAKNRVDSLAGTISNDWKHYHHCHGWGKWPCKIKWGIEIGGLKVAKGIADEALKLAKSLISHFPIDLDPRVAALLTARTTAKTALNLALDTIKGADALDGFLQKAIDKLTKDLKNSININKAAFKGDLTGVIKHDAPVDLSIDAEFFGATVKDTFAFQIGNIAKDIGKDVEHVALLGLYALHSLVEKGISDIPGPLKNKLKGAIARKFDAAQAKKKRTLAKYNLAFDKYNKTAELIQADYAAYSLAFLAAQLSKSANPLDHDTSETFAGELIEVGHSGLCLTNIGGLVKQHTCTDSDDKRWSTRAASGAAGVKAGLGYKYIF